jgi:hypothetical protein
MLWPSQGIAVNWFIEQTKSVAAELFKPRRVKLKDEDVEWEMIWDAEGGMHLLNKGPKVVPALVQSTTTTPMRYIRKILSNDLIYMLLMPEYHLLSPYCVHISFDTIAMQRECCKTCRPRSVHGHNCENTDSFQPYEPIFKHLHAKGENKDQSIFS